MSLRKKHEVKNSRSSLPNHMYLSFVDINILMLTINIICPKKMKFTYGTICQV